MTHEACIGVGSNIAPEKNVAAARSMLQDVFSSFRASEFVMTAPIGDIEQNDYLNGVFCIQTTWSEKQLTAWLKTTETQLGRIKTADSHGPRTIDLDVVVWDGEIRDHDFYERDFLKNAILELLPDLAY
jgi:2-amino-4-hydroxy-6-hydroxymethyldihydropteridine diphosphokinase